MAAVVGVVSILLLLIVVVVLSAYGQKTSSRRYFALFSTFLDWFRIGRLSEQEKDVEILLLRQQLIIVDTYDRAV